MTTPAGRSRQWEELQNFRQPCAMDQLERCWMENLFSQYGALYRLDLQLPCDGLSITEGFVPCTVKRDPAVAEIFGLEEAEQSWPVQCRCNSDIAKDFLRYSLGLVKLPECWHGVSSLMSLSWDTFQKRILTLCRKWAVLK
ncbi:uncharacterized protein J5F26_000920 isoform 1-T1 [Ciconia maguari]